MPFSGPSAKGMGGARAGAGRPAGVPNKATQRAREAVAMLIEGNLDNMAIWLNQVAEEDPKAALRVMTDLLEFHLPKLARTEISGLDGGAINIIASKEDENL